MLSEGFLGRASTFGADLNLLVQLALGLLLFAGLLLVRRSRYALHGACQSIALVATLVMTAIWMRTLITVWWLALLLGVLTYWFATS